MELILFVGLQASGKSTFYRVRFFATHVRISLDLLRTRHRESRLLSVCLETGQPCVIDNTNPSRAERVKYLTAAKAARYSVAAYFFESNIEECLARNRLRAEPVPDVGLFDTARKLEVPTLDEGFDTLKFVRMTERGFLVEDGSHEV